MFALDTFFDGVNFAERLGRSASTCNACDHVELMIVQQVHRHRTGLVSDWGPQLRLRIRIREPFKQHADYRPALAVKENVSPNDGNIAGESALPKTPGKDH